MDWRDAENLKTILRLPQFCWVMCETFKAEIEQTGFRRVFEIKRKKKLIDLKRVQEKFAAFVRASGEWKRAKPDFVALSMDEM